MSMKFSRNRGRVQPTPTICKKPPIPQPPGEPIEALAANVLWLGYTDDGTPFNLAAVIGLAHHAAPGESYWQGTALSGPFSIRVTLWTLDDFKTLEVGLHAEVLGVPKAEPGTHHKSERQRPFDSGRITSWTPTPPSTTIELRVRG